MGFLALVTATMAIVAAISASSANTVANAASVIPAQVVVELPGKDTVRLPFVISGWAVGETDTKGGTGRIQVLDGGCEGAVIGIAEYGLERPDIASVYGEQALHSGWAFDVDRLHLGERTLAVRTQGAGGQGYTACQSIPLTVNAR